MSGNIDTPIERALWFIESHFRRDVGLDEVAEMCSVSRFQMSRAFSETVGRPMSQYVRGRRLTEAARVLAAGSTNILDVALQVGYNSHEAFTRAFRDQFGLTPGQVRNRKQLSDLRLIDPVRRDPMVPVELGLPRIERRRPMSIAGLGVRSVTRDTAGIPALWQSFSEHLGCIPGQVGRSAYGLCMYSAEGRNPCQYLAGVEVRDLLLIDDVLIGFRIPTQRYAIFWHSGHVTTILSTVYAIFDDWLPRSGFSIGGFPDLIECYDERFDPQSGWGGFELWLPLL